VASPDWFPAHQAGFRARGIVNTARPVSGAGMRGPRQTKNLTNITEASSQCEVHVPAVGSVLRGRAKDSALRAGVVYVVVKKVPEADTGWSKNPP